MSEVKITKITDGAYGNLVHMTNGIVEFAASLDFGPRILRFNICGKENMLYNDTQKKPINNDEFPEFGGGTFKVYGGHRLWVSPEIMPRCYYPDDFPVTLIEREKGITLKAPIEKYNNIQKSITIEMNEYNAEVDIINTIENAGAWDVMFAPWALTMMDKGGVEVVPNADRQTGFLNNRFIALWPYSRLTDERVFLGDKYIVLKQDPSIAEPFKIGVNNEKGWVAYFNKGQMFVKRYQHVYDGIYPDSAGCSYETYTCGEFLEMETLGQMGVVSPGVIVSHAERWALYQEDFVPGKDETKITEVVGKYI